VRGNLLTYEIASPAYAEPALMKMGGGRLVTLLVMTYDELLDEIWQDKDDVIYNRVSFHISKIFVILIGST